MAAFSLNQTIFNDVSSQRIASDDSIAIWSSLAFISQTSSSSQDKFERHFHQLLFSISKQVLGIFAADSLMFLRRFDAVIAGVREICVEIRINLVSCSSADNSQSIRNGWDSPTSCIKSWVHLVWLKSSIYLKNPTPRHVFIVLAGSCILHATLRMWALHSFPLLFCLDRII